MSIARSLLPEFDHEMATTRTLLERVPEAHRDWTPHPRSWSLGDLATHVVNLLTWTGPIFRATELDIDPVEGPPWGRPTFPGTDALIERFDRQVADVRDLVAGQADEAFFVPWTLRKRGNVVVTLPRIACWRSFIMNHGIHHRGQLSVYLRLRDVPLPSIYGPTADTGW